MEDSRPYIPVETRWRGYGLPESELPALLRTLSTEIDNAWQEEQAKTAGQFLTADSYRRVSHTMGPLALNVTGAALGWHRRGNEEEKEIGVKILLHHSLLSIIVSIDRVKLHYPQARLVEEDILEGGLVIAMKWINNIKEKDIDQLWERIDNNVFAYGRTVFARNIGLPVSWVEREWHTKIPAFRDNFLAENDRYPSIEEIIERFNIAQKNAPQCRRILQRFLYPGEEPEELVEDKAIRTITGEEGKKTVGEVLSTLSGRGKKVLEERFGLHQDGREMTLEKVGTQLGVTRERIRSIQVKALKDL